MDAKIMQELPQTPLQKHLQPSAAMTDTPITEDFKARIADLEKELEEYRVLVNNSPDLLYRTDLEGRIIFVSSSVKRLSGYSVEEATGMNMAKEVYLFPEERRNFLELLRKNKRVTNFITQLKRKDGSLWWASTNAHFYTDKHGQPRGVEGITRDVSELKNTEEALQLAVDAGLDLVLHQP